MKRSMKYLFFFLLFYMSRVYGQAPEIEWQNSIGGVGVEYMSDFELTSDGGYIVGSSSSSWISVDKTENSFGLLDYWPVKLDSSGNILWQKTIGGDNNDYLRSVKPTMDGGYILGGYSNSGISGIKTEGSFLGSYDYWVVKIDNTGNIEWQNTIGGNYDDFLKSVALTSDGGFILGGYSFSDMSGDKTEGNLGLVDYWVIKLDSSGNIQWQNTIGGNLYDELNSISQTNDGGYILGGNSSSDISGDKTEPSILNIAGNTTDYWVIKLDSSGSIQWQNTIGGDFTDFLFKIEQTTDNNYILGGSSSSDISGDKTEPNWGTSAHDYWIIKIDTSGNILWQKAIGGNYDEGSFGVDISQTTDGGYIIGGSSTSGISGNKTELNWGEKDYWIVKIDSIGNVEWDKAYGGNLEENLFGLKKSVDDGYFVGGYSTSGISGNKTDDASPGHDLWVIKLEGSCDPLIYYADYDGDSFGDNSVTQYTCAIPVGYVLDSTDCNDINNLINPGSPEICNGIDDNCNFIIDDGLPVYDYYYDGDEDGYGDILIEITTCNDIPPTGFVIDNTDCDDTEDLIHEPILYYSDTDGDLYGDELNSDFFCTIIPPTGYVINKLDCNDSNNVINPLSNETCNNIDDNCNSEIDEGLLTQTLFIDADNDNFGNLLIDTITCFFEIAGYVPDNTDCDDSNPLVYSDAPEILDGLDNNCNQVIDEGVGINGLTNENKILIYPNPANDILNIEYSGADFMSFEILNAIGEKFLFGEMNNSQFVIDISNLAGGVYFFRVTNDVLRFEFEFVKE